MTAIDPNLRVTISDIRAAGHCANMRPFFRQHGLYAEFRVMIKGGSISAQQLLDTGDARAVQVVERMMAKEPRDDG